MGQIRAKLLIQPVDEGIIQVFIGYYHSELLGEAVNWDFLSTLNLKGVACNVDLA
jgi:hypothetical protein